MKAPMGRTPRIAWWRACGFRSRWFAGAMCAVAFALAGVAEGAEAEPARVALVHEAEPNALEQRTLTRLRAELIAAGFDVTDVERRGGDARDPAEAEPKVEGVVATIAILARTADAADIWVADRVSGKPVVRRIQVPPGSGRDAAPVLAVRVVEVLQASLLEAMQAPPRAEPAPPPPTPAPVASSDVSPPLQARPQREPHFAVQGGAAVIHSFAGVGPAFLPMLGFAFRPTSNLAVALRAAGPSVAADLEAPPAGSITVRQKFASLDVAYEVLSTDSIVRPVALGGVGAYHLDVVGHAAPNYNGETDGIFAAMVTFGPGAKLRLSERVSVLVDARLVLLAPPPIVRAALQEVGRMSRPSLIGEIAVDVAF